MARTGLIVEVPAAAPVVDTWREDLDPRARLGVPPHITVLFPFVPAAELDDEVLARVRSIVAEVEPFPFRLTRTGWFGSTVLWLAPEPEQAFRRLTDLVVAAYPDHPPYGGAYDDAQPHLTVGEGDDLARLEAAEQAIRPRLPIAATARSVTVMVERPDGRWDRGASIAFGRR